MIQEKSKKENQVSELENLTQQELINKIALLEKTLQGKEKEAQL